MRISPDIPVEELVDRYPAAIEFLSRRGIVCIVCGEPAWGTLEQLARRKGIEDVEKLAEELSKFLTEREAEEGTTN